MYEDSLGIPKLKAGLKMEDDVAVILPAWVWATASVLLQEHADDSSFIAAVVVATQEAMMHPAWLKARKAASHEQTENMRKMQEHLGKAIGFPFGTEEDDAI